MNPITPTHRRVAALAAAAALSGFVSAPAQAAPTPATPQASTCYSITAIGWSKRPGPHSGCRGTIIDAYPSTSAALTACKNAQWSHLSWAKSHGARNIYFSGCVSAWVVAVAGGSNGATGYAYRYSYTLP